MIYVYNVTESSGVRSGETFLESSALAPNLLAHIIERGIRELALAHGVEFTMIKRCRVEFGYDQRDPGKITISIER